MKKWKIVSNNNLFGSNNIQWEYNIEFEQNILGPYEYLFQRENLYFNEKTGKRWSQYFPLTSSAFGNTEIFLETDDIVIGLWTRWSLTGNEKKFLEFVNLKNHNKFRLYPDSVSLIYNTQNSIVIYYNKSGKDNKLTIDVTSMTKISEVSVHLSAFFKLFYNYSENSFGRLIFKSEGNSEKKWYFVEELIEHESWIIPFGFDVDNFALAVKVWYTSKREIDVWEASLTWEI